MQPMKGTSKNTLRELDVSLEATKLLFERLAGIPSDVAPAIN